MDGLLGIVRYLCMGWEYAAHDAYHVGYRHVLVLLTYNAWVGTLISIASVGIDIEISIGIGIVCVDVGDEVGYVAVWVDRQY